MSLGEAAGYTGPRRVTGSLAMSGIVVDQRRERAATMLVCPGCRGKAHTESAMTLTRNGVVGVYWPVRCRNGCVEEYWRRGQVRKRPLVTYVPIDKDEDYSANTNHKENHVYHISDEDRAMLARVREVKEEARLSWSLISARVGVAPGSLSSAISNPERYLTGPMRKKLEDWLNAAAVEAPPRAVGPSRGPRKEFMPNDEAEAAVSDEAPPIEADQATHGLVNGPASERASIILASALDGILQLLAEDYLRALLGRVGAAEIGVATCVTTTVAGGDPENAA